MHKNEKKFPDYFPAGCPPAEAEELEIEVYRLCRNIIPEEKDFETFYQINPEKWKNNFEAYGVSVFKSFIEIQTMREKDPRLRAKFKTYAAGCTYEYTGVIQHTSKKLRESHYTWWLYEGVKPHEYFKYYEFE